MKSKKSIVRLETLRFAGDLEAEVPGFLYVQGRRENFCFSFLIDETDGVITDCRFRAFGPLIFLASCDVAAEFMMRKTVLQARRLNIETIENLLKDHASDSFLETEKESIKVIPLLIQELLSQCGDISYQTPLIEAPPSQGTDPHWHERSIQEKRELIEALIDQEIRPYIELDEGGIEIIAFTGTELHIRYTGSCTQCLSATGSTLSAIQEILRSKLDSSLTVIPQF